MPKIKPRRFISFLLLALGLTALTSSIIFASSILVFLGLGLTFWGALTLYVSTEKYVRQALLDSTVISLLTDLNQILTELNYNGKAVYLPPKYLKDFETSKVYIPKHKEADLPPPEEIQEYGDRIFSENPEAALITPPGFSLLRLFERTLGTTFTKVDLEYLRKNLPNLIIEDLEIAENLEIQTRSSKETMMTDSVSPERAINDTIQVIMTNHILQGVWREKRKFSNVLGKVGCPILSAIACALAKATGRPLTIVDIQTEQDERIIKATYHILEPVSSIGQADDIQVGDSKIAATADRSRRYRTALFLIASGSTILTWIGWLTWSDVTTWRKSLFMVFFGSRTGETISLGVGMKVIYYFLIGLALLVSGLILLIMNVSRKNNLRTVQF